MAPFSNSYVVRRDPGPQTASGAGDIVTDNHGNRYRIIDAHEAAALRSGTGNNVRTLHSDGTIS